MKVGSLFSGIGGMDLGLERAGLTVRWQVENDPYCQKVLAKHWPDIPRYGDIKEVDPLDLEPVDLICGGFPCQPVSLAGKRLAQADERWLWPEFFRFVRALRPRYVLVENVPGLLSAGMGDVLGDLAACGYDAEWDCIPAAAVGAPHQRYRILIVAHAVSAGARVEIYRGCGQEWQPANSLQSKVLRQEHWQVGAERAHTDSKNVAYTNGERLQEQRQSFTTRAQLGCVERGRRSLADTDASMRHGWSDEPWRGPERRTALGWDSWWTTEPDVGRVAHGVPARVDRLRGLGNAVVPQVAEWIGRRIISSSTLSKH